MDGRMSIAEARLQYRSSMLSGFGSIFSIKNLFLDNGPPSCADRIAKRCISQASLGMSSKCGDVHHVLDCRVIWELIALPTT